jgi:hypothetical protein
VCNYSTKRINLFSYFGMHHSFNYIGNALNDNIYCTGFFFDLKKSFDVCSHEIQLMKLSKMAITGTANRSQRVDVNGNLSRLKLNLFTSRKYTRPYFIFMFHQRPHRVTTLLMLMFADDTFILDLT